MTISSTFGVNPLGYEGIDLNSVANVLPVASRIPSSLDVKPVGTIWPYNGTSPYTLYMSRGGGSWDAFVASAGNLNTLTGNSGGAISPTAGNINIVGGSGTLVAGSGSTLTITAAPQSFTWNDDPASGALVVNNGYIVKTGAKSYSLPAAAAVGDEIAIMLNGGTSWTITQAAGQSVIVGVNTSSVGVGGTVISTAIGDTIWLICTTANTGWQALSYSGGVSVT